MFENDSLDDSHLLEIEHVPLTLIYRVAAKFLFDGVQSNVELPGCGQVVAANHDGVGLELLEELRIQKAKLPLLERDIDFDGFLEKFQTLEAFNA